MVSEDPFEVARIILTSMADILVFEESDIGPSLQRCDRATAGSHVHFVAWRGLTIWACGQNGGGGTIAVKGDDDALLWVED